MHLDDLRFFQTLANAPSLAEAARQLSVSPPAVSQRLSAMEARLGLTLVNRGPNGLTLTTEGQHLRDRSMPLLEQVDDLLDDLRLQRDAIGGPLRVIAPLGFGRLCIAPLLSAFAQRHRELTTELVLSDHPRGQMQAGHWDMVINIGRLPDLSLTQTVLRQNRRLLCAAPSYLEAAPAIAHPKDLSNHRCGVVREDSADVTRWQLTHLDGAKHQTRISPTFSSNDGEVLRHWAKDGLGIIERSEWSVADDLKHGFLRQVLPDWTLPNADVVAIVQPNALRGRKVTAWLDFLRAGLAQA